ncbi:MAG TPA: PIG-L family deacetylase [Terriglobia bacterium]|nr:PIG-L family deacetylase [Terriglobia bacterium]
MKRRSSGRFSIARLAIAAGCTWLITLVMLPGQTAKFPPAEPVLSASPLGIDRGAAGVWQSLLKLHTSASLILITAHPDDEDGGMLAYESRGQGARVMQLTLNRGEGGMNMMSSDYWDALGILRTEELLAEDRYTGVSQYWTRAADFGFSKSKEESLAKWGYDRVFYDVVRVIRMTRPLVVTSVWVGGPTDGHGHHELAGQFAQQVFNAAGDPKVFPDQIQQGLKPWKPLKMYARVPRFAITSKGIYDYATRRLEPVRFEDYIHKTWINGLLSTNVQIPEGQYDPVLGDSFIQIAAQGLALQKTQNGGVGIPPAGPFLSPYHRFGSRVASKEHEQSFFDGIDTSLSGIASLAPQDQAEPLRQSLSAINQSVEAAMDGFSALHPGRIAPQLALGLKALNELIAQVNAGNLPADAKDEILYELQIKRVQFNTAITRALGLSLLATVAPEHESKSFFAALMPQPAAFNVATPGQQFAVNVHVADQGTTPVAIKDIHLTWPSGETWQVNPQCSPGVSLAGSTVADQRFAVTVAPNAASTRPYFSRPNIEQAYYDINDPTYLNHSFAPYPLTGWVDYIYHGVTIHQGQVVQTVHRVERLGPVLNPLAVGPAISIAISPRAGILPLGTKTFGITATVRSEITAKASGTLRLKLPPGWSASPQQAAFSIPASGQEQSVTFRVTCPNLQEKSYKVTALAGFDGRTYSEGFRAVGYPGLRPYNEYKAAVYRTTGVNVKVAPNLKIGYVMGSGDEVPESLGSLNLKAQLLTAQDLAAGALSQYDVILLGIRAYAVRDDLRLHNDRLLEYVKNGGVVVVEFNTPEYNHNYGPYPYDLSNNPEVVVDETSIVKILEPSNPLMTWPNKITPADFNGWYEERGHGFMKSWDSHYQALLETHDPGQDPQKGGLLVARYGQGAYVYCAYALYRQLPEGVPGAFRLLANLVSLPKNPGISALP